MNYVSTRRTAAPVTLSDAIRNGAAPDGGLYLPEIIPAQPAIASGLGLPAFAARFLAPFFEGDRLAPMLGEICANALAIPTPLVANDPDDPQRFALELFHGPTGAFKDFGARFLLDCFSRRENRDLPMTILAATSGDTGGAVGCAAEGRDGLRAVILYPKGRVSAFQERQLTCWREPVRALRVDGDFDDCQRLVKAAFGDPAVSARHGLTSANSINVGRLLPQAAYLAHAASRLHDGDGPRPGLVIPTGNLGHGYAAMLARAMGAPIGPIVLATNANATLQDYAKDGVFRPRASVPTLANAMDVGNPSNFERLVDLEGDPAALRVERVEDDAIRDRIVADYRRTATTWCPHSAVAAEAHARIDPAERRERPWILAATAHPYKFADIVEHLIGRTIDPPPALSAILARPTQVVDIVPTVAALAAAL